MGEEKGNLPYKNVTIDNNLVYTAGPQRGQAGIWHGISLYHAVNSSITNNSVLSSTQDSYDTRISLYRSSSITISGNVTDNLFVEGSSNLSSFGNHSLRDEPSFIHRIPNLNAGAAALDLDLVVSGVGYHASGSGTGGGAPPPPSNNGLHEIFGAAGSDTVSGTSQADKIFGVPKSGSSIGRHTADVLWGKGGADIFVLGDERGSFYEDGNRYNNGKQDYALVKDFQGDDRIQLSGDATDYVFKYATQNAVSGLSIFDDSNGNGTYDSKDELIGHLAGAHSLNLDAIIFTATSAAGGAVGAEIGKAIGDLLTNASGSSVDRSSVVDPGMTVHDLTGIQAASQVPAWAGHELGPAVTVRGMTAHLIMDHFVALP
jgi:Ca2+-binding RTX toxin-like protein